MVRALHTATPISDDATPTLVGGIRGSVVFRNPKVLGLILLAFANLLGQAKAQECLGLAAVMGRESQRFGDQQQKTILSKAQLCSSKYENSTADQRVSIEASYGLLSGGAKGSQEQIHTLQEQQCQGQFGYYWSSKVTSSELNTVSALGAQVINACLASQSFRLVDLALQGEGIAASYRYNGNGAIKVNGITSVPADVVTGCKVHVDGQSLSDLQSVIGMDLVSGSTLTVTCTRNPRQQNKDDGQRHYDGGLLTVATESAASILPLVSYSVPNIPEPAAESLRREVDLLRSGIGEIQQSLLSQKDGVKALFDKVGNSTVHIKNGNNGSTSCFQYCEGHWENWSGACLGTLYIAPGKKKGQFDSCFITPGGDSSIPENPVTCLCAQW